MYLAFAVLQFIIVNQALDVDCEYGQIYKFTAIFIINYIPNISLTECCSLLVCVSGSARDPRSKMRTWKQGNFASFKLSHESKQYLVRRHWTGK